MSEEYVVPKVGDYIKRLDHCGRPREVVISVSEYNGRFPQYFTHVLCTKVSGHSHIRQERFVNAHVYGLIKEGD